MSIPDTFLPTAYPVVRKPYIRGAISNSGNERDTWGPPEEHYVYGWGPPQNKAQITEPKAVYADNQRYVVELELMVPPGFMSKHRDRFVLGVTLEIFETLSPEDYEMYRMIGPIESYEANPFGWNPGSVVNLIQAEGAP